MTKGSDTSFSTKNSIVFSIYIQYDMYYYHIISLKHEDMKQ